MNPSFQWCPCLSQFSLDDSGSCIHSEDDDNHYFLRLESLTESNEQYRRKPSENPKAGGGWISVPMLAIIFPAQTNLASGHSDG